MTKCVNAETVDAASVAREVLNWLEKQSSWLLILDNVNDISVGSVKGVLRTPSPLSFFKSFILSSR